MKSPSKQGPSAEERQLSAQSAATWNDYVARFRPAEAALAKKAEFTAGESAQVQGEASADTAAAFKGLSRNTVATGGISGADVNSGKTKLNLAGDALAEGKTRGAATNAAEIGGRLDSEMQGMGIVATGRGQANMAMSNLSQGAQRATQLALAESQAKFERNQAAVNSIAAVAGAATRKFGDPFGDKLGKISEIDTSGFPSKRGLNFSDSAVSGNFKIPEMYNA